MATGCGVLTVRDTLDICSFPPVDKSGELGTIRSTGRHDAIRARLADSDFFTGKSIGELAHVQGVGPIKDVSGFAGVIPDDEDVDAMLAEIYRLREP